LELGVGTGYPLRKPRLSRVGRGRQACGHGGDNGGTLG
jgi:hypothetical protein